MDERIESLYQKIADVLYDNIPDDFQKAWIYVEMQEDFGSTGVYYQSADDQYYYAMPHDALFDLFNEMWLEYKNIGKQPWTSATFMIDQQGKFSIDFGYENIFTDGSTRSDRKTAWIRRYLGDVDLIYPQM